MASEKEVPFWLAPEHENHPPEYYDAIEMRFQGEREKRLKAHPEGNDQFTSDLSGTLATYTADPFAKEIARLASATIAWLED